MDTSRTFPSVPHIQYLNVQYSNFKSAHTHVCPKFRCIDVHSGQRRGLAWPPAKTNNRRVYERVSSCLSKEIRLQRRGHSPQFSRIEALFPPAVSILEKGIFRLVFPYIQGFRYIPARPSCALPKKKERDEILFVEFRSRSKKPNFLFFPPSTQKSRHENTREKKNPPPPPPLLSMRTNYTRFGEKGEARQIGQIAPPTLSLPQLLLSKDDVGEGEEERVGGFACAVPVAGKKQDIRHDFPEK